RPPRQSPSRCPRPRPRPPRRRRGEHSHPRPQAGEPAMPNKFEEIKNAKHPLDSYPDILRYAAMGPEGWRAITDDDKERLKWFGVFFRKPTPGHFMMRVRIPNGIATADQVRELAAITRGYGRDVIDVTTRQQVQLRWMTIAD